MFNFEQILAIEASPAIGEVAESETLAADVATIAGYVDTFKGGVDERFDTWKQEMESLQGSGKNAVLWGGGARGVSYLTMLGLDREIQCVVDINPSKQGKFMPGTGHEVAAPDRLTHDRVEHIIVMNPIYAQEIRADLDRLGVNAQLHLV